MTIQEKSGTRENELYVPIERTVKAIETRKKTVHTSSLLKHSGEQV